jgi:preprotein translocase subunit SecB
MQDNSQTPESITIHMQYIKDFSFENPKAPQVFQSLSENPEFGISLDVTANHLSNDVVEVVLLMNVKCTLHNESVFLISLEYAGVFSIAAASQEAFEKLILIQCPSILFPFARRIISDTIRDGGFPPLSINPIDFRELYLQKKEHLNGENNNPANQEPTPPSNTN